MKSAGRVALLALSALLLAAVLAAPRFALEHATLVWLVAGAAALLVLLLQVVILLRAKAAVAAAPPVPLGPRRVDFDAPYRRKQP